MNTYNLRTLQGLLTEYRHYTVGEGTYTVHRTAVARVRGQPP